MRCAAALQEMTKADKMNIAALGNMVRQLHVHVIARHEHDAAWPGPVWGSARRKAIHRKRRARFAIGCKKPSRARRSYLLGFCLWRETLCGLYRYGSSVEQFPDAVEMLIFGAGGGIGGALAAALRPYGRVTALTRQCRCH